MHPPCPFRSAAPAVIALAAALVLPVTGCTHQPGGAHHGHRGHHGGGHHGGGHGAQHRFEDAEKWARAFDSEERDAWQKPEQVVAALALDEGAKVADLGAGTGYFSVRLARAVPGGIVYGVDVEPDMVRYLDERAGKEGLGNLRGVLASPADARLPEPVDLVLLVNTYHHLEERPGYFGRLRDSLREGGQVAVVDFRPGSSIGPPEEHKLPEETVVRELEQAGYRQVARHDFLPHQYFLVMAK